MVGCGGWNARTFEVGTWVGWAVYIPPFAKARRMGHPRVCGGERKGRWVGHPPDPTRHSTASEAEVITDPVHKAPIGPILGLMDPSTYEFFHASRSVMPVAIMSRCLRAASPALPGLKLSVLKSPFSSLVT